MIVLDLDLYYVCVGAILTAMASMWAFRRGKGAFSSR